MLILGILASILYSNHELLLSSSIPRVKNGEPMLNIPLSCTQFSHSETPLKIFPKKSAFVCGWNLTSKSAFARGLDGSENSVILELKFRCFFGPSNCGAFLLRKRVSKSALISIFFSYKEISVPKIALKPLVPVRLRAVLAILRIFAHFWPRFLRRFLLHFGAQKRALFSPKNDP